MFSSLLLFSPFFWQQQDGNVSSNSLYHPLPFYLILNLYRFFQDKYIHSYHLPFLLYSDNRSTFIGDLRYSVTAQQSIGDFLLCKAHLCFCSHGQSWRGTHHFRRWDNAGDIKYLRIIVKPAYHWGLFFFIGNCVCYKTMYNKTIRVSFTLSRASR